MKLLTALSLMSVTALASTPIRNNAQVNLKYDYSEDSVTLCSGQKKFVNSSSPLPSLSIRISAN